MRLVLILVVVGSLVHPPPPGSCSKHPVAISHTPYSRVFPLARHGCLGGFLFARPSAGRLPNWLIRPPSRTHHKLDSMLLYLACSSIAIILACLSLAEWAICMVYLISR